MKPNNAKRSLFRESKAGDIPTDWECVRLGEVFSHSRAKGNAGLPTLSVTMDKGIISRDTLDRRMGPTLPPDQSLHVRKGDLAYNMMRMWQGAVGVSSTEGVVSPAYVVCRPKANKVDARFMFYVFKSHHGLFRLQSFSHGITDDRLRLYFDDFASIPVQSPPLREQRKIADILTTWDEALTQLDALIEAQERRKKALMQQVLTGKKSLPGFRGKWKRVSLGEVLEPITRTVTKPEGTFLAAGIRSHGKGVFLKPEFKPADIALEELFELKAGDLVVNITFAWEGAAAIVPPEADGALVSHRFPTFGFREGQAATSFFRHYIRTKRFVFDCGLASPGGAGRNRVLSKSAFLDIELLLPPFEEQEKIGTLLDTADQQLTLLRTQRTALDQQKRGLMQRLLTGMLRVNL